MRMIISESGSYRSKLSKQKPKGQKINKWGKYLRAPDCYLRLVQEPGSKLVRLENLIDVDFGTLTGRNEFWAPRPNHQAYERFQKVESEFRLPILARVKDCDSFVVRKRNCPHELFYCDKDMKELSHTEALRYIRWGAHQVNPDGVPWNKSGEAERRTLWYRTRRPVRGQVIFQMMIGDRHFCPANPRRYVILNNAHAGIIKNKTDREVLCGAC